MPRLRPDGGPAVLSAGFRPFFLLAGVWAIAAMVLSLGTLQGIAALPIALDPVHWHFHEMLFGYVTAAIAGFLLTAIPNWTGRLPLQGGPLLALVVLWMAGRAAMAGTALIGEAAAAAVDLIFLPAFFAVTLREVLAGRNWRNLPVVGAVGLLFLSNVLTHLDSLGLIDSAGAARRLPLAIVVLMIALIGGRIVPSFTRNWLARRQAKRLPASFGTVDRIALAITLLAAVCWTLAPESALTAAAAGLAGVANLLRLARWRGPATRSDPLLWVLHLGYLWVPVGLLLAALAALSPAVPPGAAIHALSAGAMGTMTLAVMSRATLGHGGRPLHAGPGLAAAFWLVTLAAAARVLAALWPHFFEPLIYGAAILWIAAFAAFLLVCGPLLVTRRAAG